MTNQNFPASPSSLTSPRYRPILLCILDGFGYRTSPEGNATQIAAMPTFHAAWENNPHALLDASEEHVGLPKGQMGNSEVGHMNIGAGRIVYQNLPLIDRAVADGSLTTQENLQIFIEKMKETGGTCHLMGLVSNGGVHCHIAHIKALARILSQEDIPVAVHAFLDGRDTPPESGCDFLTTLITSIETAPRTQLATICGRYYAMDRDKRWERVAQAYNLIARAQGELTTNPIDRIKDFYGEGKTDEFIPPLHLPNYKGMQHGDGILFANFRSDRARELLTAFLDPTFDGFERGEKIILTGALGMVEYSDQLNTWMTSIFPPKMIDDNLGEIIARAGMHQLRIAETEKYPHVTFFLNGGRETPYDGEDRILIPSPKVATYDLAPAMSAVAITDHVVDAIESEKYDLIILNYANPDMVGHTGVLSAAVQALETIDQCLNRVIKALKKTGGTAFVTADHGNCEMMLDDQTHGIHTAHTLNKVPAFLVNAPAEIKDLKNGKLADVAPTLLHLMHLQQPAAMDGESLLVVS